MLRLDVFPMLFETVGAPATEDALDVDAAIYLLDFCEVEEVEMVLEF